MDFQIVSIGDGMLFGATYYGRNDVEEEGLICWIIPCFASPAAA